MTDGGVGGEFFFGGVVYFIGLLTINCTTLNSTRCDRLL